MPSWVTSVSAVIPRVHLYQVGETMVGIVCEDVQGAV